MTATTTTHRARWRIAAITAVITTALLAGSCGTDSGEDADGKRQQHRH